MTASPWHRFARGLLPTRPGVLCLCLIALPAGAYRTIYNNDCEYKPIGAACNDPRSQQQPGVCMWDRCIDSENFLARGTDPTLPPVWFDCMACFNPQQVAAKRWAAREPMLGAMLGVLATGGVAAFGWFRWRRSRAPNTPRRTTP